MTGLLFVNGRVFDGQRDRGRQAVAVRDGRVVAMGDLDVAREQAGPDAEEVDLAGGMLVPGFQDAHVHPMIGGLEQLRCDLSGLGSREEYVAALRRHVAERPDDEWVRGGGWSVDMFGPEGPTASMLDEIVSDRPAFLPSTDHHDAWVNTRALEIAGITSATPDPPDGWFVRDADGNPTGTVREAAMAMVGDHVTTSREEYADALRSAQQHLYSWGITGWHDALIGGYAGLDDPTQAYLDLIAAGELNSLVHTSQWWDRDRGLEQVQDLCDQRDRLAEAGLDARSVKVMMDGVTQTFTAAMSEPYVGELHCPCGDSGLNFLSRHEAIEAVTALDDAGFQVHFHAIGDLAVTHALDAVEAARRANGMNDRRHQVAHLQLVRPEDRGRFRSLGVSANIEGMWASSMTPAVELLAPHLDDRRMQWHYPVADILAAGGHVAGGSDWPINPPDVIAAIHVLVNRCAYGSDEDAKDPLTPEQAITIEQALEAYTHGSAWVNHRTDAGMIQVGSRADAVVLDQDLCALPNEELGRTRVMRTYTEGRLVFERDGRGG
ncbi:amidohydrolase [Nocardioides donggukensis]|uniref:Amidohydrolase n=1 Tax=Nocardioides donggukensis TaxID=2774019 RepID=A0A927K117_9ACTN|nr:amidohydrolase [Nocardioides donggukensis]MBD8868077.1 amidohydrolase [Nocardioides donggukensis]